MKVFLFLSVLISTLLPTTQANQDPMINDDIPTNINKFSSEAAQKFVSAIKLSSVALVSDLGYSDAKDCYEYILVLADHGRSGLNNFRDFSKASQEFMYVIHKGPIVFQECW